MDASTDLANTVWLSLEPELECFICQEILYQPLKLIDCLHTFCGSCLKEWFSHQYGQATSSRSSSTSSNPYTCPACRANVKDAKHDATVHTLVEKFLAANPSRLRTEEDKERMAKIYKPGDNILPKVDGRKRERRTRRDDDGLEARERRMVEEARERSLRDIHGNNSSTQATLQPPSSRQSQSSRSREREQRRERRREQERQDRQERRHRAQVAEAERATEGTGDPEQQRRESTVEISAPTSSPRHPEAVEARQRQQTVVHQASLISLISNSDSNTNSSSYSSNTDSLNEETVKQLILELGLLDGVDIDAMNEAEQETFAETLAESVRRWQRNQRNNPTSENAASRNSSMASPPTTQGSSGVRIDESRRNQRRQSEGRQRPADIVPSRSGDMMLGEQNRTVRSPSAGEPRTPPLTNRPTRSQPSTNTTSLPPTSSVIISHRRRASSQGQRRERANTSPRNSSPAGNSADSRRRSTTTATNRAQSQDRVELRETSFNIVNLQPAESMNSSPNSQVRFQEPVNTSTATTATANRTEPTSVNNKQSHSSPRQHLTEPARSDPSTLHTTVHPTTQNPISTRRRTSGLFEEPSISCFKCHRADIQYEVYCHCSDCNVDLCFRCFRQKRGCMHCYGFERNVIQQFQLFSNNQTEIPHMLATGRRYRHPEQNTIVKSKLAKDGTTVIPLQTTSNPTNRFQEGRFCDRCGKVANSGFWSCNHCNYGDWGFCNDCVNTHHCCTHALLPIAHKSCAPAPSTSRPPVENMNPISGELISATGRTLTSPSQLSGAMSGESSMVGPLPDFIPMDMPTYCDICSQSISQTSYYFHCPSHPSPTSNTPESHGNYDICAPCYQRLVMTNRIKRDDGSAGWRKCPSGHRMIIITFQYDDECGRYRREVANDLVGGRKSEEEAMQAWNAELEHYRETGNGDSPTSPTSPDGSNVRRFPRARTGSFPTDQSSQANASPFSSSSKFPPDGGTGMRGQVAWSHFPDEGDENQIRELTVPRGAEVREIKILDEYPDWCGCVYAGDVGLVPTNYLNIAP